MKSQKKAGVLLSYLSQFIHIVSSLLYTPIMLRSLGQSEYGLYQLVYSTVSYLSLLSMGFTSAYIRFYSTAQKEDPQKVRQVNGMFMTIFLAMSGICLLCGAVMLANIKLLFGEGLTEAEYAKARILLCVSIFSMALSFPSSVFNCHILAKERFAYQKALDCLQNIINPFVCLPLLFMGYGSVAIVTVACCLTAARLIINGLFCIKKLKMQFSFRSFDFKIFKSMGTFTFFIFLSQLVDQLNWNVDKFMLGRLSGLTAVAIYGVGGQINSLYISFANSISNVFIPEVNRIVARDQDADKLSDIFIKVGRVQFMVVWLIFSGFMLFGNDFIGLWAGEGYDRSYWVALIMMAPMIVPLIQSIGIEIQRAKKLHHVRSVVYLCITIGNVILSFFLITYIGEVGAALGTAIALIIGNIIFMNIYYHKKLDINIPRFWKSIASFLPAILVSLIVGLITSYFLNTDSWYTLILGIGIYCLIYAGSMWLLGMNTYEKNMILHMIRRKTKEA